MTAAPIARSDFQVSASHQKHGANQVQNLAKTNADFRMNSRRDDARLIQAAFNGRTQKEMSEKASRAIGVSPRQIIYWMQCDNDMPSWAVKAVQFYLSRVESVARRIEGSE